MYYVECVECGIGGGECGWDDCEVFGDVVGDGECG